MTDYYYEKIREQLVSLKMDCFGYVLGNHSYLYLGFYWQWHFESKDWKD